ncbi:MAG: DUF4893 domain-containing protein [Mesorhizobium sp.]
MTRTAALLIAATSIATVSWASVALATGEIESLITPADRARLEAFEATRAEALKEAHDRQPDAQTATLDEVAGAKPVSWQGYDITGDWRCRTIKVGGLAQLVVYGWFKCRVSDDGSGWALEKLTGSQKTNGRFFDDGDTRMTYLGSFAVNDDPFPKYGAGPDTDQAGYAFRIDENRWRIELPAPRYESKLDILELAR